ncbi:phosphoadenylyl-sulfate reductase [Mesorhizobium camelthorni]|uniref:Adenosine 5'-phosphosulfate reductase n=1 Tax=Allomesorhizobium camelthorni TaxID=475069 RepID=A0A6G4WDC5_9HYPH|nr:phosphoadenylyl-sulfate reductase [Mesorhizobium camelthorni]
MKSYDSWPPGGSDPQIDALARRHVRHDQLDLAALLADVDVGNIALVSSFGAESAILIHMVSSALERVPILFIDTGKHFPETYAYVETLKAALNLRDVTFVKPDSKLVREEDPGGNLWRVNPNMCCTIRKNFALQDALTKFDGWISGRKRYQGGLRANLPFMERDGTLLKINPLIHYTQDMIKAYFKQHDLPLHPLLDRGYRSIGCATCTIPAKEGEDPRSGRWSGVDKVECGIHLGPSGSISRFQT